MLQLLVFLFPMLVYAESSLQFEEFSCKQARGKGSRTCDFYLCQGPEGYALGRAMNFNPTTKGFSIFPVKVQGSGSTIEKARMARVLEGGKLQHLPSAFLPSSATVMPPEIQDDFLTYKSLSTKSVYMERDLLAQTHCDDKDLNAMISKIDKARDQVRKKLQNQDYVKVVDSIQGVNVISRMELRSQVSADYCQIGKNTYATQEAQKLLAGNDFKEPTGKVLSEKEAQVLFDEVKNMKDLPWDYTADGCYARAQITAERLEKKGIAVGKAFYLGNDLWPEGAPRTEMDGWSYHVAPFVYVKGQDGKTRKMIMDPSSSQKPVESYEFAKKISPNKNTQVIESRWAGGTDMTGLPAIQMIYTNTQTYLPTQIKPSSPQKNHEDATEVNESLRQELQKQNQWRKDSLTK